MHLSSGVHLMLLPPTGYCTGGATESACEQFLGDDLGLDAGQLRAQAEVAAGAQGDVWVGRVADVQPLGLVEAGRVDVRRGQHRDDGLPAAERPAVELQVAAEIARLGGELDRADEAEQSLGRRWPGTWPRVSTNEHEVRAESKCLPRRVAQFWPSEATSPEIQGGDFVAEHPVLSRALRASG